MPMNNRIMVPRQTTHPEALAWQSAVIANGGTVSGAEMLAADQFCKTAEFGATPFRSVLYRFNPFMCGFNGALVPLFRGPSRLGTQYGGTTDTNVNFVSGDYALATGLGKATNTTAYLDTGFPANTNAAASSHLGFGLLGTESRTGAGRTAIGAFSGTVNSLEVYTRAGAATWRAGVFTRFGTTTDTLGDNVGTTGSTLAAGNIVAAWPTMFRNGVATGTDATTSQNYPSAHNIYVFAQNNAGSTVGNYTEARLGWYSIGLTMTAPQALAFHNAITTLYATIGRS